MSTAAYKRNSWVTRTVHYEYFMGNEWKQNTHVCFEKSDDLAIISTYNSAIWSKLDSFHITEIETKVHS